MELWHICNDDGSGYIPGEKYRVGRKYRVEGRIGCCCNGFHGSKLLVDALGYRRSGRIERRRITGDLDHDGDKSAGREMVVLWRLSREQSEAVLDRFARWCALRVERLALDWLWAHRREIYHRWIRDVSPWLRSGDPKLRAAAGAAARAAQNRYLHKLTNDARKTGAIIDPVIRRAMPRVRKEAA